MNHPDPWVDAFLKTDPEPENVIRVAGAFPTPLPAKVEAIFLLLQVTLGLAPKEHLRRIEWAYDEPSNVDLHLLLLITWFRALFFVQPDWSRMRVLRDRMMALISDATPPEIVGQAKVMHGLTQFYGGDTRGYISAMAEVTDGIPTSSPHYLRLSLVRVITHLQQGMGAVAEYPEAPAAVGEIFRLRLRNLRVVNAALTGDLDSVRPDEIEPISAPPNARTLLWPSEYAVACQTVRLMAEASPNAAHRRFATKVKQAFGAEELPWMTSARFLLQGKLEQALRLARTHLGEQSSRRRTVIGFDEYSLIRAELACGHADATLRLLQAREERNSWHYMDDLFWARAKLLAGSQDLAAYHFARLLSAIDKYKAEGRLDFELRLAAELGPRDLLNLTRQAGRTGVGPQQPAVAHESPQPARRGLDRLVYASAAMSAVCERILSYASSDLPVLVTGETGTGKELVARALHECGQRRGERFIPINCAALSDTLLESELFGHARGAFTGAQRDHAGLFRDAGVGTVLLDEIGDISARLQATLLRVLETGEVRPVGSSKTFKLRCRVVAATNADLQRQVEAGSFRRDLMFRLLRLHLHMPPLRERSEDIEALASYFVNVGRSAQKRAEMSESLKSQLRAHQWSGNVRELRNAIERMRVLNSDKLNYDAGDLHAALFVDGGTANYPVVPADSSAAAMNEQSPASDTPTPPLAGALQSDDAARLDRLLANNRSPLRRRERIRQLFQRVEKLQATEVAQLMGTSRHTAARDLRQLCAEGVITKVCPTASPRTHYYARVLLDNS